MAFGLHFWVMFCETSSGGIRNCGSRWSVWKWCVWGNINKHQMVSTGIASLMWICADHYVTMTSFCLSLPAVQLQIYYGKSCHLGRLVLLSRLCCFHKWYFHFVHHSSCRSPDHQHCRAHCTCFWWRMVHLLVLDKHLIQKKPKLNCFLNSQHQVICITKSFVDLSFSSPGSPQESLFQDPPAAHLGEKPSHHWIVPCCSSCFNQHNERQFHKFRLSLLRLSWRGDRGRLMKRSGFSVASLLLPRSRILRENKESKAPSWIWEIWLWLSRRLSSLKRFVKVPTAMVDSWFPQRYSMVREYKSAKVPCWIDKILFWLRKICSTLYNFEKIPASTLESWFPDMYKITSFDNPWKVSLWMWIIWLLWRYNSRSDSSPLKVSLWREVIWLSPNDIFWSRTSPPNVCWWTVEILFQPKSRLVHSVRWLNTPAWRDVRELHSRWTSRASEGMSFGTSVKFLQLL